MMISNERNYLVRGSAHREGVDVQTGELRKELCEAEYLSISRCSIWADTGLLHHQERLLALSMQY